MASGGGGYDISQSTSETASQGLSKKLGPFQVGGGVRIPEWTWPALVIGAAVVLIVWLWPKGK